MKVKSRRGAIVLPLASSEEVRPGQAFLAMHWGARSLSHDGVNALTTPAFDPVSKQPELKHAALRIEPAVLPWRMVVLRSPGSGPDAHEQVLAWRAKLAPLLAGFDYAALTLDGRERPLVALRIAMAEPLEAARIESLARALAMPEADCINYRDPSRGVIKRALITDDRLAGILLAGEDIASAWLRTALRDGVPVDSLRRWIFAPRATPPVAGATPRKVICNCLDVSEADIGKEIAAGADLATLQHRLQCGTACGSCVPEIKRMLSLTAGFSRPAPAPESCA
jgi:assimilatory nitrate reductase catalytic subunit